MGAKIIAELCQNHNGDRILLQEMVHAAAENGADIVKIQSIRSKELTHREKFDTGLVKRGKVKIIKRPYKDEYQRLKKLDLTVEEEKWFINECLRFGVSPMTTSFTRSSLREISNLGYEAIKIASYDCSSFELLKEAKKYFSKIYVSTGATYDHEIKKAAKILNGSDFELLHCVTIYPTPLEDLHLSRINYLRKYCSKVGYSDHSHVKNSGIIASKIALGLGVSCLERHFTILKDDQTKDGPVSINPNQLKELSEFNKKSRVEKMNEINNLMPNWQDLVLGDPIRELSNQEILNRDYYRGRFASFKNGIPVFNWEEVEI
jgi:N,N'-diacetyllegionaminate synthase